jgi:hypothetical protein
MMLMLFARVRETSVGIPEEAEAPSFPFPPPPPPSRALRRLEGAPRGFAAATVNASPSIGLAIAPGGCVRLVTLHGTYQHTGCHQ